MDESNGPAGTGAAAATNDSFSLLTNTTNSLTFGLVSSINDENGDHNGDNSNRLNQSENNNGITGGSSADLNEFSDVVSYYHLLIFYLTRRGKRNCFECSRSWH